MSNNGKEVCKRLKEVRREIAKANHIPLVQEECKNEGDCMGTCPKCEQEVRFLESELANRRKLGKVVSIIGIAAVSGTVALVSSGCYTRGEPNVPDAGIPPEENYITDTTSTETDSTQTSVIQLP